MRTRKRKGGRLDDKGRERAELKRKQLQSMLKATKEHSAKRMKAYK